MPRFPLNRTLLLAAFTLFHVPSVLAQSPGLIISTTSDAQIGGDPVQDEALVFHAPFASARVAIPGEGLAALAGDPDLDGLQSVFGDVDALHDAGGLPASAGWFLSIVSDEEGFLDGDVLTWAGPGVGFAVWIDEGALVDAVGATDGNIDVDALHVEADGSSILFSLAENEASNVLSGDVPGEIGDGDVLSWNASAGGSASILFTESDVDAFASAALGTPTSTGDTKGLARDPANGALLFTVQSPSDHDGSVFSTVAGGSLLDGQSEADFGFDGAVECDALTVAADAWPGLTVSDPKPGAGDVVVFSLRGAEPGTPHVLLMALSIADPWLPLAGWGGLVVANDAAFGVGLTALPALTLVPDAFGSADLGVPVPLLAPTLDLVFQVAGLSSPRRGSNPVVLELLQ